jgi:hypothetical protein
MRTIASLVLLLMVQLVSLSAQEMEKKMDHGFTLKELDTFHEILHPLVHESYPKGDYATICSHLDTLLQSAMALEKAKLPKRLKGVRKEFVAQSKVLTGEVKELLTLSDKVDDTIFGEKFNDMHETFEHLAELLR